MATPRRGRRPLLLAAAAVALATLVAPAVLGVLGLLTVAESFVVTGLVALAGAVVALGAAVLLLRRSMRQVTQEVRTQTRKVTETLGRDRLETIRALDATRARINRIQSHSLPSMTRTITGAIDRQGRRDYEQQVAWNELTRHLDTAPFMPPLRGWAASPDVLRVLVRHIDRLRPDLVVEFGSGASSVWMGYALRRAGGGRLVAVEHDARYAELSRALVGSHGLDDIVEVRTAPLTEVEAVTVAVGHEQVRAADRWYDSAVLDDLDGIGLVFVDGPPKATGRHARYPALPALMPRCTEDVVFVLDDADRPDERAIGDRWLSEYPALHRTEEHAEKGAHVFSRKGV